MFVQVPPYCASWNSSGAFFAGKPVFQLKLLVRFFFASWPIFQAVAAEVFVGLRDHVLVLTEPLIFYFFISYFKKFSCLFIHVCLFIQQNQCWPGWNVQRSLLLQYTTSYEINFKLQNHSLIWVMSCSLIRVKTAQLIQIASVFQIELVSLWGNVWNIHKV